ncbi:MAG: hypothetical protein HKM93_16375 [Desulfobacteraceae bacterium]|nr:hypothetical protein [Desulfobacteraceae bacterium]
MKKICLAVLLMICSALLLAPSPCSAEWVFQVATGSAYSFPTPLNIEQAGEDDIDITAEYETRAWSTMAPYYDFKIGKWNGNHAWEFESLHHKLFLSNKPDEVDKFAISHGYNLNTVNYAVKWKKFIYRVGLGIVMTHPESRIRGERKEDDGGFSGFYLSGVTSQVAVEKRFDFTDHWFFSIEAKLTGSYATVPVADGNATVPNAALHGLFGIGYKF